jgi:hypothetical protein
MMGTVFLVEIYGGLLYEELEDWEKGALILNPGK